jgi:hypothetical protein
MSRTVIIRTIPSISVKIAYDLTIDTAPMLIATLTTLITTNFVGWSLVDTFKDPLSTVVFSKMFNGSKLFVKIEADFSNTNKYISINGYDDWDNTTHSEGPGVEHIDTKHSINLGPMVALVRHFYVYDTPDKRSVIRFA